MFPIFHKEIVENYDEHAMPMTQIYKSCSWIKDCRTSFQGLDAPNTNNDWNTAQIDEFIKVDRRVKLLLNLTFPKLMFMKSSIINLATAKFLQVGSPSKAKI